MFMLFLVLFARPGTAITRTFTISGTVLDSKTNSPVAFAVIATDNKDIWTTADKNAHFELDNLEPGMRIFNIYSLGYMMKTIKIDITRNIENMKITLKPESLELDEVLITAESQTNKTRSSSSYKVDRTALDHLQATNLTDVMSLLPGGKFHGDINLTNSPTRFEVRGTTGEMNSTSFSTAVEIDGVRMSNNADYGKLNGIDSRSLPITNVESVEVVTGIPSVEYGDLNSGMVKINTTKGKTPFVAEFVTRPNTKLYSIRKGFNIGNATLNASAERAKSISSLISPYTTYDRNALNLNYQHHFAAGGKPLLLTVGFAGNIGGYDSKLDPDQIGDSYVKERENSARVNVGLKWVPGTRVLSSLDWTASVSYTDNLRAENELKSSSASDVAIHTTSDGYHVAEDYDKNPQADIVLLKPGTWYELMKYSSKPFYFATKLKAESRNNYWNKRIFNDVLLGAEYTVSHNFGRGTYYDDMRLAPTWRPYVLKDNPAMHNFSIFLEDNFKLHTTTDSYLEFMVGVRADCTFIKGSDYKTVTAFSPRLNLKYIVWEGKNQLVSDLKAHIGWGRAVKLPSFNILYPREIYMDLPTFTSASDANNVAFQAYRTFVNTPLYNSELRWQSSNQFEVGAETTIGGFALSLLFFMNDIKGTYIQQSRLKPFSYNYTGPSALEGLPVPSSDRIYSISKETGAITVTDSRTLGNPGKPDSYILDYVTYNRFISDNMWVNGSDSRRLGLEYIINFPKIPVINTNLRLDGNWYHYRGVNDILCQEAPGLLSTGSTSKSYKYIAHYAGPANVFNGQETDEVNMNIMLTTHIPAIRFIVSLRVETTLMNHSQNLSESSNYQRSWAIEDGSDYISDDSDIYNRGKRVVTYPEYYSTWENPERLLPFRDQLIWARDNDPVLYGELQKMVKKSNYNFIFDKKWISPYYSVNINLTKEFGKWASVSFYATNFLNNMQTVRSNWDTMKESSIYNKGYIPRFSYGLSIRLKF